MDKNEVGMKANGKWDGRDAVKELVQKYIINNNDRQLDFAIRYMLVDLLLICEQYGYNILHLLGSAAEIFQQESNFKEFIIGDTVVQYCYQYGWNGFATLNDRKEIIEYIKNGAIQGQLLTTDEHELGHSGWWKIKKLENKTKKREADMVALKIKINEKQNEIEELKKAKARARFKRSGIREMLESI